MTNIAEFNDKKGFNVKLTADKIYISAIGNEETFALRSLNGLGLYDDVEKYNKEDVIYRDGLKKKTEEKPGVKLLNDMLVICKDVMRN